MQRYEYGDAREAVAERGDDASRVISFFIFNTEVHFHAYASDGQSASDPTVSRRLDAALAACRDRCLYFEHRLSRTRPESDICRAHSCAPAEVGIASETADLIRRSLGYCERSRGTFDVTMGTVTRLWDFHEGVVPSPLSLSRALPHLGCSHIHLGGTAAAPTLSIDDPETVLDLGGVAKGYIADDLAGILLDHGVERFVINLGGNVLCVGNRPDGTPFHVALQKPFAEKRETFETLAIDGLSVVVSGVYERHFIVDGRNYHHLLDPKTGWPYDNGLISTAIISESSADGDALSTACFALGLEKGMELADSLDGVYAIFITDGYEVYYSEGAEEFLLRE